MTFAEAIAFLDERVRWGIRPGTERIEALMALLGEPQGSSPVIHVSGTNGKYSVAAMVTSLLGSLGLRAGTYTSPHLESITERIAIAGTPIAGDEFGALLGYLEPYIELVEREREDRLTYFETVTAMAFEWFFDRAVHAAVVECGLGGEYDATNVADARVAVITNVGLDHVVEFEADVRKAAWEKSGIVKQGTQVVCGVQQPDLLRIVEDRVAERNGGGLMVLGREVDVRRRLAVGGQVIDVRTSLGWYRDLFVPLHGPPQASNAALAVAACEAFAGAALDVGAVREGLSGVRVPGRIEVCARRPLVVVDGGHNPDAAHAVVASVREAFERDRLLLVVGMLEDKLVENVLDILAPAADRFIVTQPADGRAAAATRLARALRRADVPEARIAVRATVGEAIALALEEAAEDDLVLVFGSFYTAGEARRWLRAGGLLSQD